MNEAINHLKESIKNGYQYSYLSLSLLYYDLCKNYISAFNSAQEGAENGEKHCKCLIGYFIAHGIGTKKDFLKGVSIILLNKVEDFYEKFASDIGFYYAKLIELKRDTINADPNDDVNETTAFKWFEKAFNLKKTKATINNLGICYLKGYGVEKNVEKAKEIFKIGLNRNDQFLIKNDGFNFEEEDQIKSQQFKKVSELNLEINDQSEFALLNAQTDKEESIKNIKLASNQSDNNSQKSLEKHLSEENSDLSINLYKKAAENGNIEAQEFLAKKFTQENDSENSYKYCKMLIKNGHTKIPLEFAFNLYKSQKFDQAFHYFSLLNNANHPISRYFIGVMKFNGQGCEVNKNESFNIMKELSKNGIERATIFIEDYFN